MRWQQRAVSCIYNRIVLNYFTFSFRIPLPRDSAVSRPKMCTGGGDSDFTLDLKLAELFLTDTACKKCVVNDAVVVLQEEFFCKKCFLDHFVHKFRGGLGKSKQLKYGDNVLVAYSGGQASTAMLHMIELALHSDSRKKLSFSPRFLYIDEGAILEHSVSYRQSIREAVREQISWTQFPLFVISLEDIYRNGNEATYVSSCDINQPYAEWHNSCCEQQLISLFSSISSLSAKEDLLQTLRLQITCRTAELLNCDKVFLGESGTRLSTKLIVDLCQGRGVQLPENMGFCYKWSEGLSIVRPMKDFTMKEIAFYVEFNELKYKKLPTLASKDENLKSITRLTEQFLLGLQHDFPATTSTIVRTGEKIKTKRCSGLKCALCNGSMEFKVDKAVQVTSMPCNSKCVKAITVKKRHLVSQSSEACAEACAGACAAETPTTIKPTGARKREPKHKFKQHITTQDLQPHLCYGCWCTVNDMGDVHRLPEKVLSRVYERKGMKKRQRKRAEIEEYMLSEDDSD